MASLFMRSGHASFIRVYVPTADLPCMLDLLDRHPMAHARPKPVQILRLQPHGQRHRHLFRMRHANSEGGRAMKHRATRAFSGSMLAIAVGLAAFAVSTFLHIT